MASLDAYDRAARLGPAYLVFSPAVVFVVAVSLGTSDWWSKIGGALVGCGAPLRVAGWGRDGGRRRQPDLFASWGGAPTTALLRFGGGDEETVARRPSSSPGRRAWSSRPGRSRTPIRVGRTPPTTQR
jgi:hypothetical protein